MTTKQYPQHQQVFKSGLIKNNFLGHHIIKFLYRDINKEVAKKQHEIMKHISVNDWIKIEGYKRPSHQRVKGGTQYEKYNDYYLSRDFNDWTLYNNLVINLPPKKVIEWTEKNLPGCWKAKMKFKTIQDVRNYNKMMVHNGKLILNRIEKPYIDKFICPCWGPCGNNMKEAYKQTYKLNSLRRILSLMKNDYFSKEDLYGLLVINKVKGRTKLKKKGKRAMIKAYLKIKDLN
tara:strand:- start:59 stop:754 length:696 start_codon:yes stop_codon:yes gene_type:complete